MNWLLVLSILGLALSLYAFVVAFRAMRSAKRLYEDTLRRAGKLPDGDV
jgi:hypothetical protein